MLLLHPPKCITETAVVSFAAREVIAVLVKTGHRTRTIISSIPGVTSSSLRSVVAIVVVVVSRPFEVVIIVTTSTPVVVVPIVVVPESGGALREVIIVVVKPVSFSSDPDFEIFFEN